MSKSHIPDETEALTARFSVLGALVYGMASTLRPEARQQMARDLARAAREQEQHGNLASETLLIELHRATRSATPHTSASEKNSR